MKFREFFAVLYYNLVDNFKSLRCWFLCYYLKFNVKILKRNSVERIILKIYIVTKKCWKVLQSLRLDSLHFILQVIGHFPTLHVIKLMCALKSNKTNDFISFCFNIRKHSNGSEEVMTCYVKTKSFWTGNSEKITYSFLVQIPVNE